MKLKELFEDLADDQMDLNSEFVDAINAAKGLSAGEIRKLEARMGQLNGDLDDASERGDDDLVASVLDDMEALIKEIKARGTTA